MLVVSTKFCFYSISRTCGSCRLAGWMKMHFLLLANNNIIHLEDISVQILEQIFKPMYQFMDSNNC